MAKISGQHSGVLEALREWGIEPKLTTKVIIEIEWTNPVKVHVEQLGDEGVLGVMKSIGGDLCVVREVKKENLDG